MNTVLNSALTLTYNQLSTFAGLDNFWNLFDTAFGTQYNRSGAEILRLQWLSGDFGQLPQVEILDSSILGNANGAYASSNNKIYLSANFLATSTAEAISAVLLEEIGHFIDAQINLSDSAGDEGEKFSALVQGQNLTTQELDRINTENDWANITVGGEQVAVEQNTPIVLTVTTTADQNDGSATGGLSLRDAILIANANTTNDYVIELQGGQTYSLIYTTTDIDKASLRIQGNATIRAVGNQPAIIDGSQLTYTSYYYTFGNDIFRVRAQGNLTLDNITVTKATSTAIYIESNASVLMQNSTVSYTSGPFSWAYECPGIENNGTLTLQNSSVHDNTGNGIINYGTAVIRDSDIYNNKALGELIFSANGGGILNDGSVVLDNSWIYNNQGVLGSGISNGGSFTGINSVIKSNSGSSGILNRGTLDLINTAIVYNSSAFVEGAGLNNSGTANLNNTTISNNTMSGFEGGGIYNHGILNLLNSTIANNTATSGGGIYSLSGGQITLKNTIVAGNNANSGKDIYGSVTGNNNNLIGNLTEASGTVGTGTDIVNPNPGLGTLQYIGNTYIHPLLAGSPAINGGNNSLIAADTQDLDSDQNTTEIIPFDQRNLLRIFGTTVDIGAVEMSNGSGTNILPEVEGNNTFATAQVIANTSFNRQVVADIQDLNGSNISTTYDHVSILGTGDGTFDLYRFNALANTQLVFDIDNNNFDTILRLWNPNNNQLLALNDDGIETGNTGNSTASFLTYKTLTTSDYVIGVYRYSSSALTPPATGDSYTLHLSMLNDAVFTPIESAGNTKLVKDAANKYFTQVGTNTPIAIKNGGQQIYQDIYGSGWQTIAAETVNGDNQVLWKNVSGNYLHIWHLDNNWNWVSSEGNWGLNSAEALTQETNFAIDANGDGVIGYTPIELAGNTKLVKDATNKYFTQIGTNTPTAIKNGGQQIYENIYAGWQTIAAETVNSDNQVLWKNVSGNYLHIWH
ncbi:choice-of-anchor Q domain-containing protein, partial [Dolichospermum sp. UHCC 0299]|uniref:choice-of-anchor Q domain-containing protein n=1 Tax=Dolichospermum sp. UHCC 0299 TaxID=2590014 RepID=UPI00158098DB